MSSVHKTIKLNSIIFFLAIALIISCQDKEDECCFEPAGAAEYFINNQTSAVLNVTFTTSQELGLENVDSISSITIGDSKQVFKDGIIGVNPQPSNSFSQLSFSRNNDSTNQFVISSVDNSAWNILEQNLGNTGYGLTKYELTITDQNFE